MRGFGFGLGLAALSKGGGVLFDFEELTDFATVGDWTKNPFSTSGSVMADDGDGIRLSTPDTANSNISATKTFSPGLDLSAGGLLVLGLRDGNTNIQGAEVGVYLSSNNFSSSKFMFEFTGDGSLVRGAVQYAVLDLSEFSISGGESLDNLMTQVRVRLNSDAGSAAITFDKLYYIPSPGKDRPRVVLGFDDGWATQYSIAYPYLTTKGIKATFYAVKDFLDGNFMSLAQLQELYAAGHDIGNHTEDHVSFTEAALTSICASQTPVGAGALTINGTLASGGAVDLGATPRHISFVCNGNEATRWIEVTGELDGVVKSEVVIGSNGITFCSEGLFDKVTGVTVSGATAGAISVGTARTQAEAEAAIENNTTWLTANSMPRAALHLAYPRGASSPTSDAAVAAAGILTSRGTQGFNMPALFGVPDATNMPAQQQRSDVADMKAYIDLAISTGTTAHIYMHKFDPTTADDLTMLTADFQELVDYIATKRDAGLIDVLTISQWYSTVTARAREV